MLNETCTLCGREAASSYCLCQSHPMLLCAQCMSVHTQKFKDRHEILPIETFRYRLLPGYLDAYRARTGIALGAAVKRLREEVATVRVGKEQIQYEAEIIREILEKRTEELEAVAVKVETLISQAEQEIVAKGASRSQSSEANWLRH